MTDKTQPLCDDAANAPLCDEEGLENLSNAILFLAETYSKIPEEYLDNSTINVNAGKIVDIMEMLLAFAEQYEGINIEELADMTEIENSLGAQHAKGYYRH